MEFAISVLSLTIFIEAVTLFLRMVFHYKSAEAQKKIQEETEAGPATKK